MVEICPSRNVSGFRRLPPNIVQLICFQLLDLSDATHLMALSRHHYQMLAKSPIANQQLLRAITR